MSDNTSVGLPDGAWRLVRISRSLAVAAVLGFLLATGQFSLAVRASVLGVLLLLGSGVFDSRHRDAFRKNRSSLIIALIFAIAYPLTGQAPLWLPMTMIGLVVLPWPVALLTTTWQSTADSTEDDHRAKAIDRQIGSAALFEILDDWLWRPALLGTVVLVTLSLDFGSMLALVPLAAAFLRMRRTSLGTLGFTFVVVGPSPGMLLAAVWVAGLWLPSVLGRTPRRSLGLPALPSYTRSPFGRWSLAKADSHLRLGEFEEALRRYRMVGQQSPLALHARLREARCLLDAGEWQRSLDTIGDPADWPLPSLSAAACRLRGEALLEANQVEEALRCLEPVLTADSPRPDEKARAAILLGEAYSLSGRFIDAITVLEGVAHQLPGNRNMDARVRAIRAEAFAIWRSGEVDRALEVAQLVAGEMFRGRWLRRQFVSDGGSENLLWSRKAPVLAELVKLSSLEAEIELSAGAEDVLDQLLDCREYFELLRMRIDAAETSGIIASAYAQQNKPIDALNHALVGLAELDRMRYTLRGPAFRMRWNVRFAAALTDALDLAGRVSGNAELQAELIEIARLQSLPLISSGQQAVEDASLSVAPTVRVRGRARIGREAVEEGVPAADLERAAASAAGEDAWWYSTWLSGGRLFWALVPPEGTIHYGNVAADTGSKLEGALADLRRCLPALLPGETRAAMDQRLGKSPLHRSPEEETELARRLGKLLLPQHLRAELARCCARNKPRLRLAIAAAPQLGFVPWSILAIEDRSSPTRLVEAADWVLAPSAGLLASASTDRSVHPAPLRLAVLDPCNTQEFAGLNAAQRLRPNLPKDALTLGGRHWTGHDGPATPEAVMTTLGRLPTDSTVLFACHARRGSVDQPSASALVLAAPESDGGRGSSMLTAGELIAASGRGHSTPRQVHLGACDTSDLASSAAGEWLTLAPAFLAAGARTVTTTAYPLIDAPTDPAKDLVNAALHSGTDLAEAVWGMQRSGLASWRRSTDRRNRSDTPLVWAAHAVCAAGRGVGPQITVKPDSQSDLSSRCLDALIGAHRLAREIGDSVVTSSHFVANYLIDEVEYYESTFAREAAATFGFRALAKVMRAPGAPSSSGSRPSVELLEALRLASTLASEEGIPAQPEHVLRATQILNSRGARLQRLVGATRKPQVLGEIRRNLAHARAGATHNRIRLRESDHRTSEFVDGVVATLASDIARP